MKKRIDTYHISKFWITCLLLLLVTQIIRNLMIANTDILDFFLLAGYIVYIILTIKVLNRSKIDFTLQTWITCLILMIITGLLNSLVFANYSIISNILISIIYLCGSTFTITLFYIIYSYAVGQENQEKKDFNQFMFGVSIFSFKGAAFILLLGIILLFMHSAYGYIFGVIFILIFIYIIYKSYRKNSK
jgi:hypothetical protein